MVQEVLRIRNPFALVAAVAWLIVPMAWSTATILDRTQVWEDAPRRAFTIGWAVVVWTTVFGVALLVIGRADLRIRRVASLVGGAMLVATASQIVLTVLKLGTPDSYGDYPIAWTTATFIATLGAAAAMVLLSRQEVVAVDESVVAMA